MKKVTFQYGSRAWEYHYDEFFVPDETTEEEIREMVEDKVGWWFNFDIEDGYEESKDN